MPEEFEHELIGVLQEHYGKNFDYNWDSEEDFILKIVMVKQFNNTEITITIKL